ncbi:MAG: alpha/beta hydrolase [Anaerolineae bacterium]|nr:alpha/beta hydrolase [Anaerolineae bacterium]
MSQQSGFADVNGARLYYEAAGAGEPLMLIHAGIADHRMWDDQWPVFTDQYRTIRYDVRGFGQSVMPAGVYDQTDDLYALLRLLHVEQTHVLAVSMGVGIALDFTLAHPAMVKSLIAVAPGASGGQPSETVRQQWAEIEALAQQGDIPGAVELELRMWVDGPRRTPDQVDGTVRARVRDMNLVNFQNSLSEQGIPLTPERPAMARLAEIAVPTLVIVGDADVADILRNADSLAARIAGASKVVMPGVAHVPNMERPQDFNRIVLEFLRGL